MRRLLIATAIVLASATSALASPSDDVAKALVGLGTATSYHMAIQSSHGQTMDVDVVRPNKMHMTMPQMEMISVAGGTYVKVNGNWMKLPGAMPQQMQSAGFGYVQTLANSKPTDVTVDDLGTRSVDGASYHAYKVVRFSKFNAPISIDAPI